MSSLYNVHASRTGDLSKHNGTIVDLLGRFKAKCKCGWSKKAKYQKDARKNLWIHFGIYEEEINL